MKDLVIQLTLLNISNEDNRNFNVQISLAPLLKYQKIKIKKLLSLFLLEKKTTLTNIYKFCIFKNALLIYYRRQNKHKPRLAFKTRDNCQ